MPYYFDTSEVAAIEIESVSSYALIYENYANGYTEIQSESTINFDYSKQIDLMPLVPVKFTTSTVLQAYITELNRYVGSWMSSIDDLQPLQDPYNAPAAYLINLAKMLNVKLNNTSEISTEYLRSQILHAVDWYKIKGSYSAFQLVAASAGVTVNIYDLWSKDYVNFVKVDWWVGDYGEYPPTLDASYYKTPHFVFEVVLDKVYGSGSTAYLLTSTTTDTMFSLCESVRPANTVPSYDILLSPVTYEDHNTYTTTADVMASVTSNWEYSFTYFDDTSSSAWTFDDATTFDTEYDAFINSVTKWKIGNGNKSVDPSSSGFALDSVTDSGTIDTVTVYTNRIEYEFFVSASTTLTETSELGLFLGDNTTMVAAATFPNVSKGTGMRLRVLFTIYRIGG